MTIGCQIWVLDTERDEVVYKGRISITKDKQSFNSISDKANIIFDLAITPGQDMNLLGGDGVEFAVGVGSLSNRRNPKMGAVMFFKLKRNGFGQFMI